MQDAKGMRHRKALGAFSVLILVMSTLSLFSAFPRTAAAASLTNKASQLTKAAALATVQYEAESTYLIGGTKIDTSASGHSGSGYVDGFTAVGAKAIFTVNIPSAGTYAVTT